MSDPSEPEYEVRDNAQFEKLRHWAQMDYPRAPKDFSYGCIKKGCSCITAIAVTPYLFVWAGYVILKRIGLWFEERKFGVFDPSEMIKTSDTRAIRFFMKECYSSDLERRGFFTPVVTRLLTLQTTEPMDATDIAHMLGYLQRRDWDDDRLYLAVLKRIGEFGGQDAVEFLENQLSHRRFTGPGEVNYMRPELRNAMMAAYEQISERIKGNRHSGMLLRPAELDHDTLLRPVGVGDANPDELLRPTDAP